ncbi:uncharacterized protein UMAG_02056 [Mycosarcoma maydis]|uniref:Zinc finger protein 830 n=1 Tax=Mycosarcoma maydis TaxID=5270 RepID=A0A0D1C7N3_MYCMD|nr:uncharacterized protein UMAG_02056 [Ustilago maydis 521]KIS69517.1 hypothetical protein UMAG_02056 [Ustilago maydis 521]|eukprot:XP_011388437.1 hypothetical protein UMAG_02056 [Ustilago maydis 521]
MTGDARSLLRAVASERAKLGASGVSDAFASYSANGGLRCSACDYLAIKHESLWGAHVLSKSHRTNVARIHKEEQVRQAELERTKAGKRKATQGDGRDASPSDAAADATHARSTLASKKARADTEQVVTDTPPTLDPEWELFKSQVESIEPDLDHPSDTPIAGAALEAEPQLISQDDLDQRHDTDAVLWEKSAEELEAEERARIEQQEREEILSRMEEEQRQQDEADQRVSALKQRLQRLKQARLDRQKANKKA